MGGRPQPDVAADPDAIRQTVDQGRDGEGYRTQFLQLLEAARALSTSQAVAR